MKNVCFFVINCYIVKYQDFVVLAAALFQKYFRAPDACLSERSCKSHVSFSYIHAWTDFLVWSSYSLKTPKARIHFLSSFCVLVKTRLCWWLMGSVSVFVFHSPGVKMDRMNALSDLMLVYCVCCALFGLHLGDGAGSLVFLESKHMDSLSVCIFNQTCYLDGVTLLFCHFCASVCDIRVQVICIFLARISFQPLSSGLPLEHHILFLLCNSFVCFSTVCPVLAPFLCVKWNGKSGWASKKCLNLCLRFSWSLKTWVQLHLSVVFILYWPETMWLVTLSEAVFSWGDVWVVS